MANFIARKPRRPLRFAAAAIFPCVAVLLAGEAAAAPYTWSAPANGDWSSAGNWAGGTIPPDDGTADIVLTPVKPDAGGQGRYSYVDRAWTVSSVRFENAGTGGSLNLALSGGGSLRIGAGGILGGTAAGWLFQRAAVTLTTAESQILNGMFWYGNLDSSHPGGTRVRLRLTEFRADAMTTTSNVFFRLESGAPALYGASLNSLGSNKLLVTLADPAGKPDLLRGIGIYGITTNSHLHFDTPIEFDAATMGSGDRLPFNLTVQRTGTVSLVTHIRGEWTQVNGSKIANQGGLGWIWLSGGGPAGNSTATRTYYEQDSRTLVSDAVGPDAWAGDVFVYHGIHVIAAPHAFKADNGAFFNLGGASGGATGVTNNMLLATSGNDVAGAIRLCGGDSVTSGNPGENSRPWATIGLEGAGEVAFKGRILLDRRASAESSKGMNLRLFAGPAGAATFSGGIAESSLNGKDEAGIVHVAGGGTVILSGANTYTNTTTVLESTTLRLEGAMDTHRLEVGPGATLSGSGRISGRLACAGIAAPGPGGLRIGGDAEFEPGSELRFEIPADGSEGGTLEVAGTLDLSNARLAVSGGRVNATYTIATAGRLVGVPSSTARVQADGNALRVTILKDGSAVSGKGGMAPAATPSVPAAGSALRINGLPAGEPISAEAGGLRVRTPQGAETLIPWPELSPGTRYRHEPGFPERLRPPDAPADADPLWPATPRT